METLSTVLKFRSSWPWVLLIGLWVWATFGWLNVFGLLDNNEGLYAEIAREMVESGDWLTPRLNYVPYLEKPPLLYWSLAVSMSLLGASEFAVRLVPGLFLGGTIAAVVWLAWRLGRRRAGWLAGLILSSASGFVVLNRTTLFDVPLTCCLAWSLAFFGLWLRAAGHKPRHWVWGFWIFLALAVMAKGLVALVLAGLVGVTGLIIYRPPWRMLGRLFDPIGLLFFALITAPWHLIMVFREPGFAWFYFINEHVLRFLGRRAPDDYYGGCWHYYLIRLPMYLAAWLVFLPLVIRRYLDAPEHKWRCYLWAWFLLLLVFFTIARAKANYYLMPAIPALVLLMALSWDELIDHGPSRWLVACTGVLGGVILVAVLDLPFVIRHVPEAALIRQQAPFYILVPAVFWPLLAAAAWSMALRGRNTAVAVLVALMGTLPLPVVVHSLALREQELSQRTLARWIQSQPPAAVFLYLDYEDLSSIQFYLAHKLPIVDSESRDLYYPQRVHHDPTVFYNRAQFRALARREPVYIVVAREHQAGILPELQRAGFRVAAEFALALVLTNRP